MSTLKEGPLFVTGAAGFIGARFVEFCNSKQIPLISVDALDYFNDRKEHKTLSFGKIIDREKAIEWLSKEKPNLAGIIHLGACTDTTEMDEAFLNRVNLEYSQALWKIATDLKIPFIYASSGATYGEGENGYDDDPKKIPTLKPLNPYGVSKQRFDLWVLEQVKQKHTPLSWAGFKFFNVYGFGERHKGKMSSVVLQSFDLINKTGEAKLFKSHRSGIENGHQKRDFIYVEDVVDVLFFALTHPIKEGIFNLGTGQARTFLDLTKAVFKELHKPEKITFIDTPIEIRDRYQYFTEAKMDRLRLAGYRKPFTSLEEGVKKYIQRLINNSNL